jgi:hypothetical protein
VLVSAHNGTVDHRVFVVGVGYQMLKYPLPDAGFRPSGKAAVHVLPITEAFGQITPRNAGPVTIQYRLDEQAVVRCGDTDRTLPAGQ